MKRADADKPFMGLITFKGDIPVLSDVVIAKNYLSEDELKVLNNLVSGYFDFAEIQAIRHNTMYMEDWKNEVENTLKVFHQEEKEKSHINKQSKKQKTNMKNIKLYRIRIMCQILIDYKVKQSKLKINKLHIG